MKRFKPIDGEVILIEEPIHWKNYILPATLLAICVFGMLFRAYFPKESLLNALLKANYIDAETQKIITGSEILFMAVFALQAFVKIMRVSYVRYYVTSKRIISITGILNINIQEMLISRCEMVYMNQNVYERMFNTGDILAVSAGANIFLDDVYDALRFKEIILEEMNKVSQPSGIEVLRAMRDMETRAHAKIDEQ